MLVPLNWLRDYVAVDVPVEELAARVNVAVAEVERIIHRGVPDQDGNLGLYRVGRVLEAGKHPNADRLQLCKVDVGRASRARSSVARGTSARGQPSRSRYPVPSFRTGGGWSRLSSAGPSRTG